MLISESQDLKNPCLPSGLWHLKLCSLKCYVLGVLQGPLSRLGLMRQNTALSRDGKVLSVCSIDAPRERSFVEKMDYF